MTTSNYTVFDVGDIELEIFAAPNNKKKAQVHSATKLVRRDGHISYVNAKGEMFSSRIGAGKWHAGRRYTGRHLGAIEDAITLGVLPKESTSIVLAAAEERERKYVLSYNAGYALESLAICGIKLTSAQESKLKRMVVEGKKE